MLGGAQYTDTQDLIDVYYEGVSVLDNPGGTQLETPRIYPGGDLRFSLYETINNPYYDSWDDYLVFVSNCEYAVCGTLNNPLDAPSEWGTPFHTSDSYYTVPTEASNHYLAVVPADDVSFGGELGSVVFLRVTTSRVERPITTCAELQSMNDYLMDDYTLLNDLNCAETESWNSGAGFVPVGSFLNPFIGLFDGQHHTISNLHINRDAYYIGFLELSKNIVLYPV